MAEPNHPWNPLPVLPRGDDSADVLYMAVGKALSTWELMEAMLGIVFARLVLAEYEGAQRAYGTITSFAGRKDMLDAAFEAFPHRKDIPEFKGVLKKVSNFSPRRNEIAHGMVLPVGHSGNPSGDYYLLPATYNSRKRLSSVEYLDRYADVPDRPWHVGLSYAYTSAQVNYYQLEFVQLTADVQQLADHIGKVINQHRKQSLDKVSG